MKKEYTESAIDEMLKKLEAKFGSEKLEKPKKKPRRDEGDRALLDMLRETLSEAQSAQAEEAPRADEPLIEEPIVEESVVEESVVEEPVVEEPVVEESIVEEIVEIPVEAPVAEPPKRERKARERKPKRQAIPRPVEEPIVEEPIIEEPIVEEPIVEEPIVEEPIIEEPIAEEPIVEEPIVEKQEEKAVRVRVQEIPASAFVQAPPPRQEITQLPKRTVKKPVSNRIVIKPPTVVKETAVPSDPSVHIIRPPARSSVAEPIIIRPRRASNPIRPTVKGEDPLPTHSLTIDLCKKKKN